MDSVMTDCLDYFDSHEALVSRFHILLYSREADPQNVFALDQEVGQLQWLVFAEMLLPAQFQTFLVYVKEDVIWPRCG
jgi:hypothetical protein